MSSPILPIQGPSGHISPTHEATAAIDDIVSFVGELAGADSMIDAARGGPPPAVLEQMAAAAQASEQLRQDGHELRFRAPRPGGRVAIDMCNTEGHTIRTVSLLEAFDIAAAQGS